MEKGIESVEGVHRVLEGMGARTWATKLVENTLESEYWYPIASTVPRL